MDKVHIGTSGWYYDHWRGPFYPEKLKKDRFLEFYSDHFKTVEINSSFYHLPQEKTFERWRDLVPEGFIFAVKASRFITHIKKLKDAQEPLKTFLQRARLLKEKLGPVLFQLPPSLKFSQEVLETFLRSLPTDFHYSFEFRDATWLNDTTYGILAKHSVALCIHDFAPKLQDKRVTSDFVYTRFHGRSGRYMGQYGAERLTDWVEDIKGWIKDGLEIFCYFNNDLSGYAVQDALKLGEML
jgi:uncharacterized protein YecE (DUF72 family)